MISCGSARPSRGPLSHTSPRRRPPARDVVAGPPLQAGVRRLWRAPPPALQVNGSSAYRGSGCGGRGTALGHERTGLAGRSGQCGESSAALPAVVPDPGQDVRGLHGAGGLAGRGRAGDRALRGVADRTGGQGPGQVDPGAGVGAQRAAGAQAGHDDPEAAAGPGQGAGAGAGAVGPAAQDPGADSPVLRVAAGDGAVDRDPECVGVVTTRCRALTVNEAASAPTRRV